MYTWYILYSLIPQYNNKFMSYMALQAADENVQS